MKNLKTFITLIFSFLFMSSFSQNKIISQFYDEHTSRDIFLLTTTKKDTFSISILENGDYVSCGLYSENNSKFTVYDLKGKKVLEGELEKTIEEINREGKKVLSKDSIEAGRASDCLGGSTIGCFLTAWSACSDDFVCSLLCRGAGWYCPAAILVSCFIHCNF